MLVGALETYASAQAQAVEPGSNSAFCLKISNYIIVTKITNKQSNCLILLNGNPGLGSRGAFFRVLFVKVAAIYVPEFGN